MAMRIRMTVLALVALPLTGCGVGEYQQRIEQGVKELSSSSVYQKLNPSTPIGDTPVEIRVPQQFEQAPLVDGAPIPESGEPPEPTRVRPLGLEIPGLRLTYEGHVEDSAGGKIPYYLYVSVADKETHARRKADLTARLQALFREVLPEARFDWQQVQVPTPQGGGVDWKYTRLDAEQPFRYIGPEGDVRKVEMPGVLDFYHRVEGDWLVTLIWRLPRSIVGSVELDRWAPMVAGTVKVKSGDAPATPQP